MVNGNTSSKIWPVNVQVRYRYGLAMLTSVWDAAYSLVKRKDPKFKREPQSRVS